LVSNDDGGVNVAEDSVTGNHSDSYLQEFLAAGSYQIALTESANYANGPTLGDGFVFDGHGETSVAQVHTRASSSSILHSASGDEWQPNLQGDLAAVRQQGWGQWADNCQRRQWTLDRGWRHRLNNPFQGTIVAPPIGISTAGVYLVIDATAAVKNWVDNIVRITDHSDPGNTWPIRSA